MEESLKSPHLPAAVEAEQTHLRLPSSLDWIQPTVDYLKNKAILCGACQESRAIKLTIALHEALSNSVVHGNLELSSELRERSDNAFAEALAARAADPHYASRTVEILVDYDGERCQWTLTDQGKGFDVERLLQRDASEPSELMMASGRGILIMRTFLDEIRYEDGGRRTILTLRKASGEEKRRHDRVPLQKRVRIAPIRQDGTVDWDAAYEGMSRNLSQEGMSLLQAKLSATGRVIIGIDAEGQPLYLPAEIRHWRKVGDDMVELGCRFHTRSEAVPTEAPLPSLPSFEVAIDTLIGRLSDRKLEHDERRAHPRVTYAERVGIECKSLTGRLYGFARDLSRTGMALVTTSPVPLEVVVLTLPTPDKGTLQVQAQVLRCARVMDGYFDVGARFVGMAGE